MHTREVRAGLLLLVCIAAAGCGSQTAVHRATPLRVRPAVTRRRRPAVRYVRGAHHDAVPILEYHVIGVAPARALYEELYVPPDEFAQQLAYLAQHHWHPVTMDAVLRYWLHGVALPPKPVVLTFDDGYPGDWRYALPDLERYHWPGNLNLQVRNLVPKYVRELIAAGWEVDAHTFTHPDLRTVGAARLRYEVAGSRAWIRRVYRVPAHTFCYPLGDYDKAVVAAARRAGFTAAETQNFGWAQPSQGLLTLDRMRVYPHGGLVALAAELREG